MKKFYWISMFAAIAAVAFSCSDSDNEGTGPETYKLEVSEDKISFAAEDNEPYKIDVTAENVEWRAVVDGGAKAWLHVEASEGFFTVSADDNFDENRNGAITVSSTKEGLVESVRVEVSQIAEHYDIVFTKAVNQYYEYAGLGNYYLRLGNGDVGIVGNFLEVSNGLMLEITCFGDLVEDYYTVTLPEGEYGVSENLEYFAIEAGYVFDPSMPDLLLGSNIHEYENKNTVSTGMITGGTMNVSTKDGNVYKITCDLTTHENKSVKALFVGEIKHVNMMPPPFWSTLKEDLNFTSELNCELIFLGSAVTPDTYYWIMNLYSPTLAFDQETGKPLGTGAHIDINFLSSSEGSREQLHEGKYAIQRDAAEPFTVEQGYVTMFENGSWYWWYENDELTGYAPFHVGEVEVEITGANSYVIKIAVEDDNGHKMNIRFEDEIDYFDDWSDIYEQLGSRSSAQTYLPGWRLPVHGNPKAKAAGRY